MFSAFRALMSEKENPLNALPSAQRFQLMLWLSLMWTSIFCGIAGAWLWYGELMIGHLLFAMGFAVTGVTFSSVKQGGTYRDVPASDGTTRYDDVWGG
ncbi:hypothetical protein N9452_06765 [Alphaproteobacteria bacterium]|nr:hypothetical protein [Alphaproteobacteria bacterium]